MHWRSTTLASPKNESGAIQIKADQGDPATTPLNKEKRTKVVKEALENPAQHPPQIQGTVARFGENSPYGIEIWKQSKGSDNFTKCVLIKDEKARTPHVELERGDCFSIIIRNTSGQPVAVALSLDGINHFEFSTQEPFRTLGKLVVRNESGFVQGWYIDEHELRKFEIMDWGQAAAGQLGRVTDVGMITATFCQVLDTGKASSPPAPASDAVGVGESIKNEGRVIRAVIGEPLGIVSIRYKVGHPPGLPTGAQPNASGSKVEKSIGFTTVSGRFMNSLLRPVDRVCIILLALLATCSTSAFAGVHAIVIGVSDYADESLHDLPFVQLDVERVRRVLESFAGPDLQLVDLHPGNLSSHLKPTKSNIVATLEKASREATADDVLIFYFSGHGHAGDETVYLVPSDGQLTRPAETMVPASVVRNHLASSPARHKIVLLDSCHSGAAASNGPFQPADAEILARSLEPAASQNQTVYTMTSCSADEESFPLLLDASKPSVFTYWLEHALRGNANTNLDDVLDGQEVFNFVETQVTRSSSNYKKQTPKLLTSNSDITRLPVLWKIQPRTFRSVAEDSVKTMTSDLAYSNARRVGLIPFFQGETARDASYSSDFVLVCRQWAADALHEFTNHAQSLDLPLSYFGESSLETSLRKLEFAPYHAESSEMIRRLASQEQLDAIISGQILGANPDEYTFSLVAYSAEGVRLSDPIIAKGIVAADQVALLRSVDARKSSQRAQDEAISRAGEVSGPNITAQLKLKEDQLLAADLSKQGPDTRHPLEDPSWPFHVSLNVDGQTPAPIFVGGECFTPVKEGKSFVVRVENRGDQMVMMRLLVDGFHTLPTIDTKETLSARQLADARAWVLDPGKTYVIPGFVMELGGDEETSKVREFEVVDASSSLARQRNYTKHIGVVTAVFYTARSATRGVGVRPGRQSRVAIGRRRGFVPDRLLGSVHIRYFDPKYGHPSDSQPPTDK